MLQLKPLSLLALPLTLSLITSTPSFASAQATGPRILIYSATQPGEFRHDSIPTGIRVITRGAGSIAEGAVVESTEDATAFRFEEGEEGGLKTYDAVVFLSTVGNGVFGLPLPKR